MKDNKTKRKNFKIFISLKLKIISLMLILLIFMVFIVIKIIITLETKLLYNQFKNNINIYFETFKKNIELFYQKKLDNDGLQSFLTSFENINIC